MTVYTLTAAHGTFAVSGHNTVFKANHIPSLELKRANTMENIKITPTIRWHRDYRW